MILTVIETCHNPLLATVLAAFKRIMLLIQIIVPIILIIWGTISFIKMINNPDDKKGTKSIINKFIAAAIVFFIPIIVNALMSMLGESSEFSSCWINADEKITQSNNYYDTNEGKPRNTIGNNPSDYKK